MSSSDLRPDQVAIRRRLKAAQFAIAGFLDVALAGLLVARLDVVASLVWGLVGAGVAAGLYLAVGLAARRSGVGAGDSSRDEDDWLSDFAREAEKSGSGSSEGSTKSMWSRLGDDLFAGSIVAVAAVLAYVVGFLLRS